MNPTPPQVISPWLARVFMGWLVVWCAAQGRPSQAQDLPVASDGQHLWLVREDPEPGDRARVLIYHLAADAKRGQMVELDPLKGELMPRGVAAGRGRLLVVLSDGGVRQYRPVWSDLLQRWAYTQRELPGLPEGVALLAVAVDERGPWALVRVESSTTLEQLDRVRQRRAAVDRSAVLNRLLGLPEDFELTPDSDDPSDQQPPDPPTPDGDPADGEPLAADSADGESAVTAEPGGPADGQSPAPDTSAEDANLPAYRLIHLHKGRWASSPLPDSFNPPRYASLLLRPGAERPTILLNDTFSLRSDLTRFSPLSIDPAAGPGDDTAPGEARQGPATPVSAWQQSRLMPRPSIMLGWTALHLDGQLVLVVERATTETSVTAEAYLLRGRDAIRVGRIDLPTNGRARWSAVPWRGGVALVAVPGPELREPAGGVQPIVPLGGLMALTLDGAPVVDDPDDNGIVVLYEHSPTPLEGNADLLIQILAFLTAMVVMMLFYRRAPRGDQIDLPDNVMLATFGRRLLAGVIDLLPGFWLAGLVYDITIGETVLYWPGNGVAKALPAMRPGFLVIAVTLVHTTAFEFVTARSMGKWFTGLYVADLDGKPAPPTPSLLRAVSRVFDLFAPLMLVLPVISPGRQRLGDILAKTIVVMRLPEEPDEQEAMGDDDY